MRENTLAEVVIDKELDSVCEKSGCEQYKDILVTWCEKLDKEGSAEKFAVGLFGVTAIQVI